MASIISIPLHHLPLLLLLVQFTHSAIIPKPMNGTAHKPQPSSSSIYIVQANQLSKPPHFATLEHWYASMVDTYSPRATTSGRILYTYDTVMHGFAVQLTEAEAWRMSSVPGVSGVHKDRLYYTKTTRSPGFIGLEPEFGAWLDTDFGDGIIIGFVDSGIWPESASFNDSGLGSVRSSWRGKCVGGEGFNASLCNNKLVGAKDFTASKGVGVPSPKDEMGHGTHVASTAAGSEVRDANLFMFSRGIARGMAPKARIAMYKACDLGGCPGSAIVAAVDAAVKDGVDLISMSLGGYWPRPLYDDIIAIATFGAERKGVFVVLAGGNEGPGASTVTNVAPWMTTVGAATVDRLFPANLILGNRQVIIGQSLYTMQANGTSMIQLMSSSCDGSDLAPDRIMGKIVVCRRRVGAAYGILVQKAGGAGLISVDRGERFRDGVTAFAFTLPALTLSYTTSEKLNAYMASVPYPVASFSSSCETMTGENRAAMVVGFSSRGPNAIVPEILKPDVIAPGLNILAAWPGNLSLSSPSIDMRRSSYNIMSGTSMACPHVAGVAALIKKKHGNWTPAMVRSALMTTAGALDNCERDILDNGVSGHANDVGYAKAATPLEAGAGLVRPRLVLDPGLVYDAGTQDYIDFLCTLNYTAEQLRRLVPDLVNCTRTLPGGAANLNYPSFVVVFDGHTNVRTLTRTVTKVSAQPETYDVTVVVPDGVKATVTPTTLHFNEQNEKRSYTVEFKSEAGANVNTGWGFGHVTWENREHQVRSPVAFMWTS